SEDGKFKANSSTAKFTISKYASQVSISVGESYNVGDDFTIAIVNNTAASVTINGNVYAVKADGTVDVDTTKLAAGEYTVVASIAENDKYLANSSTATFKLSKVETPANDTTIPVDGAAKESKIPTYSINLPNDATGTLTVTIDNKNYTAIVTNGKASVSVPNLPAGNYKVTIAYSGDDKYSPIVKNTTTTVVVDPKVVAKQTSALYTAKYSVTVYGKDDKVAKNTNVVFYINGKKVKTVNTSTNGVATFNIPSNYLPNKKYTIKAVALGKSASKKVTIKQIVTLKTVKFKKSAKKAVVLTATLKKVNGKYQVGKKITFYFKGKKVKTVKTGKKGVAKVTLKKSLYRNLKVGKIVSYKAVYLKTKVVKKAEIKK
ncbi:Ig-like domain-containing protein, partial [Methanobrevibacter sp.]|uniref:Ig-like domain-containing protein n=1 Tax=Methanobrevibacter sp. TaxID=66852 RepID=UPI00388D394D